MPGLDRKGPLGSGPKTGRGMGLCQDSAIAQDTERGFFRGAGMGMGRRSGSANGRGGRQRNRCYSDRGLISPVTGDSNELSWVKSQIQSLGQMLERIEARISGKSDLTEK